MIEASGIFYSLLIHKQINDLLLLEKELIEWDLWHDMYVQELLSFKLLFLTNLPKLSSDSNK